MERGLLWLPLLAVFIGLAWAGWNEYQKLEAYNAWADAFEQSKYDIYSALGVKDKQLTWGVPTRQGPINLQTVDLTDVQDIYVKVDDTPIETDQPLPSGKKAILWLSLQNDVICNIPFTQAELAVQWATFLKRQCPQISS
ncbi:MAG: hypothetical protein AAFU78_02340 [Cyanobacteria bacterium J06633_2]